MIDTFYVRYPLRDGMTVEQGTGLALADLRKQAGVMRLHARSKPAVELIRVDGQPTIEASIKIRARHNRPRLPNHLAQDPDGLPTSHGARQHHLKGRVAA